MSSSSLLSAFSIFLGSVMGDRGEGVECMVRRHSGGVANLLRFLIGLTVYVALVWSVGWLRRAPNRP
jgi:hypothetical protein